MRKQLLNQLKDAYVALDAATDKESQKLRKQDIKDIKNELKKVR